MGYTHFDRVSGINAVAVGKKGSESVIADSTGIKNQVLICTNVYNTTTAAATTYTVCPVAGTITGGYVVYSVAGGTAKTVTVSLGSAGADYYATAATNSQVAGGTVVMSAQAGNTALAAGASLKITLAACATAQADVGVVIVVTKS
jgi:hypothetical protein